MHDAVIGAIGIRRGVWCGFFGEAMSIGDEVVINELGSDFDVSECFGEALFEEWWSGEVAHRCSAKALREGLEFPGRVEQESPHNIGDVPVWCPFPVGGLVE